MKLRRLTPAERALAQAVFGAALDTRPLVLVSGAPTRGYAMVLGPMMVFPERIADFAAADSRVVAWFVHELTHAWQFQARPLWTLASWLRVLIGGGYGRERRGYTYTLPLDWPTLNLEQQARAVEHRWLLSRGLNSATAPHDPLPKGAGPADYAEIPLRGNP